MPNTVINMRRSGLHVDVGGTLCPEKEEERRGDQGKLNALSHGVRSFINRKPLVSALRSNRPRQDHLIIEDGYVRWSEQPLVDRVEANATGGKLPRPIAFL